MDHDASKLWLSSVGSHHAATLPLIALLSLSNSVFPSGSVHSADLMDVHASVTML